MPTFEEQMATDLSNILAAEEFEETVTYTTPSGTATSGVKTVYQEYLGAIDEKTQAVFILPVATISSPVRGATITRTNGEVWTVIDVSQRDAAASNCRAVLPQLST